MIKKIVAVAMCSLALVGVMAPQTTSAQTRTFKFHMSSKYAHGKKPNNGYVASKADNEQRAYITVTQYAVSSGDPTVSMYVSPAGTFHQVTTAFSWTSPSKQIVDYYERGYKGNSYQLCAEQFGGGAVVVSGRWTP